MNRSDEAAESFRENVFSTINKEEMMSCRENVFSTINKEEMMSCQENKVFSTRNKEETPQPAPKKSSRLSPFSFESESTPSVPPGQFPSHMRVFSMTGIIPGFGEKTIDILHNIDTSIRDTNDILPRRYCVSRPGYLKHMRNLRGYLSRTRADSLENAGHRHPACMDPYYNDWSRLNPYRHLLNYPDPLHRCYRELRRSGDFTYPYRRMNYPNNPLENLKLLLSNKTATDSLTTSMKSLEISKKERESHEK